MAKKVLLQGNAGNYRIRGAIWELGSFAYRAYVHLVPTVARSDLSRWVVSADGMTLQEVLGAAKERVKSTVGTPVERLELVHRETAPTPQPDIEHSTPLRQRPVPRRYPPPTDYGPVRRGSSPRAALLVGAPGNQLGGVVPVRAFESQVRWPL